MEGCCHEHPLYGILVLLREKLSVAPIMVNSRRTTYFRVSSSGSDKSPLFLMQTC